jgi:hypothetical protein
LLLPPDDEPPDRLNPEPVPAAAANERVPPPPERTQELPDPEPWVDAAGDEAANDEPDDQEPPDDLDDPRVGRKMVPPRCR